MSEMVERVARVILGANPTDKTEASKVARAAIAAMREPTDAMHKAGIAALTEEHEEWDEGIGIFEADDLAVWQAMIDEALKEDAPAAEAGCGTTAR